MPYYYLHSLCHCIPALDPHHFPLHHHHHHHHHQTKIRLLNSNWNQYQKKNYPYHWIMWILKLVFVYLVICNFGESKIKKQTTTIIRNKQQEITYSLVRPCWYVGKSPKEEEGEEEEEEEEEEDNSSSLWFYLKKKKRKQKYKKLIITQTKQIKQIKKIKQIKQIKNLRENRINANVSLSSLSSFLFSSSSLCLF